MQGERQTAQMGNVDSLPDGERRFFGRGLVLGLYTCGWYLSSIVGP